MRIFDTRNEMIRELLFPGYVGVEIGVLRGDFADELYKLLPLHLHLVDLWQGIVYSGDENGNNPMSHNLDIYYENIVNKYKDNNNVHIHRNDSISFLRGCDNAMFDFVYIDANHTFYDAYNDIKESWDKVKPGGYLCGHDFSLTYKCKHNWIFGVDQAVYQFCRDINKPISALAMDGCVSFAIKK
jgi:hypothetical protein